MCLKSKHLLGVIYHWNEAGIDFKSFCWVIHYIVYNDEIRECVGRSFPWDPLLGRGPNGEQPSPPLIDLRNNPEYWPPFVSTKELLEEFIWYCSYWFTVLCKNPVFQLYRVGGELGIGVRLKDHVDGKTWTVDQIRGALFMVSQKVSDPEDLLLFVKMGFPSIYQTSAMKTKGTGVLPYGPGMLVNSYLQYHHPLLPDLEEMTEQHRQTIDLDHYYLYFHQYHLYYHYYYY
jgi:hypothetical protein